MKNSALQLASQFAFAPNAHGYCGMQSASQAFQSCIASGKCDGVPSELKHFITLYPYLKTISKIRRLPYFDYKVIEAYWIGNSLLKDFPITGYDVLLDEFGKQGVPKWLIKDLGGRRPKVFIPHHLFQVLHVGVGQASGSVPFNIKSINDCMIRTGTVVDISGKSIKANVTCLKAKNGGYEEYQKTVISKCNQDVYKPKQGDLVAIHWGNVVKKLTKIEYVSLRKWSSKVLESLELTF